ncbi:type II toxin-antitoxin system VapC family toxin [Okeania sp. SIO2C9]|uniref:type II toxin-antitoxin system VapC family toxin n=1 Tax=Okeania sp. SIO2C9 TaxID=2607791 RepID=UPI0025D50A9F|nr:PIN domain-containing protein [Okeania sp. SIO2C9]
MNFGVKVLFDTQILLWYLLSDQRLSLQLQRAIADHNNKLWLSPISIWETLILAEKGWMSLQLNPVIWVNLARSTQ